MTKMLMPMKQKPMMAMMPTTRLCVTDESLTAGKRNMPSTAHGRGRL